MHWSCRYQLDAADMPLLAAAAAVDPSSKHTHASVEAFHPHALLPKWYPPVFDSYLPSTGHNNSPYQKGLSGGCNIWAGGSGGGTIAIVVVIAMLSSRWNED